MRILKSILPSLFLLFLASLSLEQSLPAQQPDRIVASPGGGFVPLSGSVAPIVGWAKDLGRVDATLPFEHVLLQLKRSPASEAALDKAINELHDPKSRSFHHWMTAAEFGERFGASDAQIARVSDWLAGYGLTVEGTNEGRTVLQFSGQASRLENAFQTEIHTLNVGGKAHVSNISEPRVPAAFAGLIRGVSMSDFKPHPLVKGARSMQRNPTTKTYVQVGKASADFTVPADKTIYELVAPADFATIYNLTPLWNIGFRGKGQTVAVVEDTLMKPADVTTFRNAFGLSKYAGTFVQELPAGSLPCGNPGVNGAEIEAALDAEWAGATAPDAIVVLAACADTRTEIGGLIAVNNLLSQKNPPQTISISYGSCEAEMGSVQLTQFSSIFQQAVAEGVTVFVSSGDEGGASCDANREYAQNGLQTSGFTTTPYDVSVGGTDFYDSAIGTNSKYWSATNSTTFSSALSYIPEKTWNNSCADSTVLIYTGFAVAYGTAGLCNNSPGYNWVTTGSGSGGPSAVYSKPSWQAVSGNPADGARDIPDVSLFSASGFWGHALVFCDSDKKSYGVPCNYANPSDAILDIAGGTSFASPAMAGIFTLITQKYGRQGNANIGLYKLAVNEYGTQAAPKNAATCDSTKGTDTAASCTFYDVTQGNIDVPCIGANCYGTQVTYSSPSFTQYALGVLSTDSTRATPAYPTTAGWDFATGLGSVNATNLFKNWVRVSPAVQSTPAN